MGGFSLIVSAILTLWLQRKHVSVYGSLVDITPDSLHAVPPIDQQAGARQRGEQHTA